MAAIYVRRIKTGQMTLDMVPTFWREQVKPRFRTCKNAGKPAFRLRWTTWEAGTLLSGI